MSTISDFQLKGRIKVTGKAVELKAENIMMAFSKSDQFPAYKKDGNLAIHAQEFAARFTRNFVFQEEDAHTEIGNFIINEFENWNQ